MAKQREYYYPAVCVLAMSGMASMENIVILVTIQTSKCFKAIVSSIVSSK